MHGHWKATQWLISGERADHELILKPDATFRWSQDSSGRGLTTLSGTWRRESVGGTDTVTFQPDEPIDDRFGPLVYTIGTVSTCQDSNFVMVLRWFAIASRNLPIMFYRVHPAGCGCGMHD